MTTAAGAGESPHPLPSSGGSGPRPPKRALTCATRRGDRVAAQLLAPPPSLSAPRPAPGCCSHGGASEEAGRGLR